MQTNSKLGYNILLKSRVLNVLSEEVGSHNKKLSCLAMGEDKYEENGVSIIEWF